MKPRIARTLFAALIVVIMLNLVFSAQSGLAQAPEITETPPPQPAAVSRPLLYVSMYSPRPGVGVDPWSTFKFEAEINNNGDIRALNVVLNFESADFTPLDGGVWTQRDIEPSAPKSGDVVSHHFRVSDDATWKYSGILRANVSYSDIYGNAYTETFTFTIAINQQPTGPTRTPTLAPAAERPLLVVSAYETDVVPLQPGTQFKLKLNVHNVGSANATGVSLVYGGGVATTTDVEGTPQPGGVSGGGSDTTNFAPLGTSNVVLLGDVPAGGTSTDSQDFIVNVSTVPGVYPLKVSFVYTDPKGVRHVDDQVITLQVYALPQLEVSFYRDPGPINMGQQAQLPIQITNLAKKSVVLGNLTITSPAGEVMNNTALVGTLDPGGYFTHDAMFSPNAEGKAKLNFEIRYTDDFNQLRTFNQSMEVDVMPAIEMPAGEPILGPDGKPILDEQGNPIMGDPNDPGMMPPEPVEEPGFFAKIWNAIKSFFGMGTEDAAPGMEGMPEGMPEGGGGGMMP